MAREPQRNTNYELIEAMAQIAREKSVDKATVIDTLVAGLMSAGRKRFGLEAKLDVAFDEVSGRIVMRLTRKVVEDAEDPGLEIDLSEAQATDENRHLRRRQRQQDILSVC